MAAAIEIRGVTMRGRHSGADEQNLLTDLCLSLPAKSLSVLIGPSGSGKSTLLRLINRLGDPDSGEIFFFDQNIKNLDVLDLRRSVALVGQDPNLFPGSVGENISYADKIKNTPPDLEKVRELLDFIDLKDISVDRNVRELSVGQQQRINLARALYLRPRVLMLDETTASLDPKLSNRILEQLKNGRPHPIDAIVHITHEPKKAALSDYIFLLEDGRISESGPTEKMLGQNECRVCAFLAGEEAAAI